MIFIFYIQTHNYTITPSYRLRFVNGTNSRLRLVIRRVLIYLKRVSTTTLAYHLVIASQTRDLAKFIMPDFELNVAPRLSKDPIFIVISLSTKPGRVAQSVGHLTRKSGVLGSIPGLAT